MTRARVFSGAFLLVFVLSFSVTMFTSMSKPAPATALPSACNLIPDPTLKKACELGQKAIDAIPGVPSPGDVTKTVAKELYQATFGTLLDGMVQAEATAIEYVLKYMNKFVLDSSTPTVDTEAFKRLFLLNMMFAPLLAGFLFFGRGTKAAGDSDPLEFGKILVLTAAFIPVSTAFTGFTQSVIYFVDGHFTPWLASIFDSELKQGLGGFKVNFEESMSVKNNPVAPLLMIILLAFGVVGGVLNWLAMVWRMAMLEIITPLAPFAFAAAIGRNWTGRIFWAFMKMWLGLIVMKPAMLYFMVTSAIIINLSEDSLTAVAVACLLLILTPVLAFKAYHKIANHQVQFTPAVMLFAYARRKAKI